MKFYRWILNLLFREYWRLKLGMTRKEYKYYFKYVQNDIEITEEVYKYHKEAFK